MTRADRNRVLAALVAEFLAPVVEDALRPGAEPDNLTAMLRLPDGRNLMVALWDPKAVPSHPPPAEAPPAKRKS